MLRAGSPGWSDQRCSSNVIAPGCGNLGLRPNPPFTGSNTLAIWVTASSSIWSDGSPGAASFEVVADHAPDRLRLRLHLSAPRAIGVEHALEHGAEARPAVRAVGRKVGAAVEHFAGRREKGRQRPAALPGERLHRPLVAGVDVRTLVPVHLDADEMLVEELGEGRILVGLAVHHVAPVTPDGADVEQHRAVLRAGGLRRPRRPRDTSGWADGRRTADRPRWPPRGGWWSSLARCHRWKVAKRAHLRAPFQCCLQRREPLRQVGFLWLSE